MIETEEQSEQKDVNKQYQQECKDTDKQTHSYVADYEEEVIRENSMTIIYYAIVVYFLYLLIDIALFNVHSFSLSQYERRYLVQQEALITVDLNAKVDNVKMFVDLFRDLTSLSITTTTAQCNQTRYNCSIASDTKTWDYIQPYYNIIQHMHQSLISPLSQVKDSQVFLISSNLSQPVYPIFLQNSKNSIISSSLSQWTLSRDQQKYLFKIIKKEVSLTTSNQTEINLLDDKFSYKILFCGLFNSNIKFHSICVISPGHLFTLPSRSGIDNPLVLVTDDVIIININRSAYVDICQQCGNGVTLESIAAQTIPIVNASTSDKSFLEAFPLSNCINEYKKTDSLIKTHLRICNPPQLFCFLSRITLIISSTLEISSKNYKQSLKLPTKSATYKINFLIFSNTTFNQRETQRMKAFNVKQAYTLQVLVFIVSLWLIFMPIMPIRMIQKEVVLPVNLIIKMCNVVKAIKTKDQLELQIDAFNKLHMEINKIQHIFYSTIQYFKYFIWYRKWLYTVKNSKKKALLQQGLSLFGSADYAPVYMYIFQKQIQMDIKLAQNFKKMRKIFTQKFTVYQNEQKIDGSINMKKPRNVASNVKKSGFGKQQIEDNDVEESMDFCMVQNTDKKMESRINKQFQIMCIQKKSKRVVRFSHDEEKPLQNVVSKFFFNLNSHGPKNSQKYIEEEGKKRDREEEQIVSGMADSRQSRDKQLRDQESSESDQNYENWNHFMKFDELDESNSMDDIEDECFDLKKLTYKILDTKLGLSYSNIYHTYQKMIIIKKMYLDKQDITEVHDYINKLYIMLIERLRYFYKFIKHKHSQKQKMLKSIHRRRNTVATQKNINEGNQKQKNQRTQKLIHEDLSVIDEEIQEESKYIDIEFKEFTELQQKYKVEPDLMQRARLYQTKLLKTLNYPIQYKKLQNLCQSKNMDIRVQARIIMSQQFFYISPHADMQAMYRAEQNLQQPSTTHVQKQKTLKLIKQVLNNREMMEDEQNQINLIQNYYNYLHKKFYFVVDLTDSYEVFRPTLAEIYRNMGQVDMFQIMNLAMNQILQDMVVSTNQIKPNNLQDFEVKFQGVYNQANRIKSVISTKFGSKRMAFQKDFNRIISKIQKQQINLSKFIVLILGGQNESQSKTHQDYESSSAQNRQIYQIVHQQILSKLQRNYFHVILVGFNLKDYQTRQGKLKKYVRHTHDLLEIDLSKPNISNYYKQLAKFLNK